MGIERMTDAPSALPPRSRAVALLHWVRGPGWRSWLIDAAISATLLAVGFAQLLEGAGARGGRPVPPALMMTTSHFALLGMAAAALTLRSRASWLALALVTLCGAPFWLVNPRHLALLPIVLVAEFSVMADASLSRAQAWVAAVASGGLLILALFAAGTPQPAALQTTSAMAIVAVIFLGDSTRNRRALTVEAEQRAAEAERSRDDHALRRVSEERLQIARELHDIVAHNISIINVQAGVAAHLKERRPDEIRESFETIRRVSHQTLDEMRALVGVLREPVEGGPSAPTAGLEGLDSLLDTVRASGSVVALAIEGDRRQLPATVDVSAFRIVQEAVTNAMRYGSGSPILVRLHYTETALHINVINDIAATANRDNSLGGHGIDGMRERTLALGGAFEAGSTTEGTFRIHAELPLRGGAR